MLYQCTKCGRKNNVPQDRSSTEFLCGRCDAPLPKMPVQTDTGDASAAFGMIGGAALGGSIAGPFGAIIGAVVGNVVGRNAKGVG